MNVIRTLTFRLDLPEESHNALKETMRAYTTAYNMAVAWGYSNGTWNKVSVHNATYYEIRKSVPALPSSLVQCARDCACESLKSVTCEMLPSRKPFAAVRYNQRVITVNLVHAKATIASTAGRVRATFFVSDYCKRFLNWKTTSSALSYDRAKQVFYLHVSVESPDPETVGEVNVLGIDRGIVNLAVCSDNRFYNSNRVKNARARYARLRAELQSKGTRSARRKLKRMSRRETRFVTDVNHCISKQIVSTPYTVFAIEDLGKIRVQKRRGTEMNRKLNNWSFHQLEQFLRYKAEAIGKRVILVDARYTSQKCSKCGHVYKGNRDGSDFLCRKCGFHIHADLNASRNIAHAGISGMGGLPVKQPIVASN